MARYILTSSVVGQPARGAYARYARGTPIADTAENALAGDIVWPALCNAPSSANMAPLDSAAQALLPGSQIITLAELAAGQAPGAPITG